MASERGKLRGVVLTEDRRTERFIRHLLRALGYDKRKFRFFPVPDGRGAGDAWVLRRYPSEVKVLRVKNKQRLCLIAIRDGDAVGVEGRKAELDEALRQAGMAPHGTSERIATPVPTWAIENWLLDLLDHPNVNEAKQPSEDAGPTWKQIFERDHGADEKRALDEAAGKWAHTAVRLPSLADGRPELARIDE